MGFLGGIRDAVTDVVRAHSMGTVSKAGHRLMVTMSYIAAGISFLYACAYLTVPRVVNRSLLADLAEHWVWGGIQAALFIVVVVAQAQGGFRARIVHAVGAGVQFFYLAFWLMTMLITAVEPGPVAGAFVCPGILAALSIHYALSKLQWPTRAEAKRRYA